MEKLTDNEIIKAFEWCEQFENNIVMSNRSGEKFILALQAMQIIKQALKEHTCQKAEIERLKGDNDMLSKNLHNLCKELDEEKLKNF